MKENLFVRIHLESAGQFEKCSVEKYIHLTTVVTIFCQFEVVLLALNEMHRMKFLQHLVGRLLKFFLNFVRAALAMAFPILLTENGT